MKGNKMTDTQSETDVTETVEEIAAVPDISVYEAKIEELSNELAGRQAIIDGLNADLSNAKAANYDLLMSMPTGDANTNGSSDVETDTETVIPDIDDLFISSKDN